MAPGTMENAGVLNSDLNVTNNTFLRFVEDVKKCLRGDQLSFPFDCGPKLDPNPNASAFDGLEDPSLFPHFHEFWRDRYTKVARSYNMQGNMPLFPICDPTALALLFDLSPPPLEIPEILAKIALGPAILPELIALIPDLTAKLVPPFVDIIAELPAIPPIPDVPVPTLPPFPFDTKFAFELLQFLIPLKAFGLLIPGKLPEIVLDPTIPGLISLACEAIVDASPGSEEQNDTRNCANKVLAIHQTTFLQINLVGATVGNGLLVKAQGASHGYKPDPSPEPVDPTAGGVGVLNRIFAPKIFTPEELAKQEERTGIPHLPTMNLEDTPVEFRDELIKISNELGTDPNFIAAAIALESAHTYAPDVVPGPSRGIAGSNVKETRFGIPWKSGNSIGIVQWEPFGASVVNKSPYTSPKVNITRDGLLKMTSTEQLKFVKALYQHITQGGKRAAPNSAASAEIAINRPDSYGAVQRSGPNAAQDETGRGAARGAQGIWFAAKNRGKIQPKP